MAAGGSEGIVADGFSGGGGGRSRGFVGEGKTGLAKGVKGNKGTGRREPFSGLKKDVGSIGGLKRKSQARHCLSLRSAIGYGRSRVNLNWVCSICWIGLGEVI